MKALNDTSTLIKRSREKLKQAVEDNDFKSIKFVLENLDPDFNIDVKELLNSYFEKVAIMITDNAVLSADVKTELISNLKAIFDE